MFAAIVVGTDGSQTAGEAVRQATELARLTGARVHVVSAYEAVGSAHLRDAPNHAPDESEWTVNPRDEAEAALRAAADGLRAAGVDVATYARQGDPADAILDVAEEQRADAIVVGNKGMTGAERFLLGSVPNKLSHHAPCSVVIIRTS